MSTELGRFERRWGTVGDGVRPAPAVSSRSWSTTSCTPSSVCASAPASASCSLCRRAPALSLPWSPSSSPSAGSPICVCVCVHERVCVFAQGMGSSFGREQCPRDRLPRLDFDGKCHGCIHVDTAVCGAACTEFRVVNEFSWQRFQWHRGASTRLLCLKHLDGRSREDKDCDPRSGPPPGVARRQGARPRAARWSRAFGEMKVHVKGGGGSPCAPLGASAVPPRGGRLRALRHVQKQAGSNPGRMPLVRLGVAIQCRER